MSKCPKCDNELKLIQKCTVRDKEFHLYRCLNCRRLFIENNIENEKEVFDSFIKTPDFLEEKLQYFISYLISKGRFIYAKEYVELYKSKFTADSRLLMNEFLINLRCKNENDLQFYIKNVKDFDQLNNLILSLENDKRQKLTKFFLVSLTNCANIFGGSDLLKCDKIFENILGISNTPQIFKKEIAGFAKVCVNKNNNEIAEKYYSLIGENLKEKNYSIDHSTLPNNKKTNESKKQETDQTKFQREEKHHDESKIQEKTQEKEQKDKIKKIRVKKPASEKSGKIKRIVLGVCSAIFIIAIVIVGAFYFKGGFKSNNLNDSLEDSSNTNNGFQTETFAILPIEGNYTIVADYYENQLQPAHGDIWEVHSMGTNRRNWSNIMRKIWDTNI